MSVLYKILDTVTLSDELINRIESLDYRQLKIATRYGRYDYIKSLVQYHKLAWLDILGWLTAYGWAFSKAGTIDSCCLPAAVEAAVIEELKTFFSEHIIKDCVVRLQVVYGGELIPLHVDITRTSSMVYPIKHESHSNTVLCKRVAAITPNEQFFKQQECSEVVSVSIDKFPVLLDTKAIHGVFYRRGSLTKEHPRVSLTVKWKTLTISEILNDMHRR